MCIRDSSIPACKLIENFFYELATKFPAAKFLKSVSSVCIPNYPDKNLPTIFVYCDGEMRKQFIGPAELGGTSLTQDGQYINRQFSIKVLKWDELTTLSPSQLYEIVPIPTPSPHVLSPSLLLSSESPSLPQTI